MLLKERLSRMTFYYKGSRPQYTIHDAVPDVLVLDKHYKHDSILGWNLNYYTGDKNELEQKVNRAVEHVKWFHKKAKLKRYKLIKEKFPLMSKFIRRYKKDFIEVI